MADLENKLNDKDLSFLDECINLAEEALRAGDSPFGSILVDKDGNIIARARNRVNERNSLAHPEFELARWALDNLSLEDRRKAVMYTTGEHCPMCAAAHGHACIGSVVYLSSSDQYSTWRKEMGAPESPINFYPIKAIVKNIHVKGPAPEDWTKRIKALHEAYYRKSGK